MKKLVLYTILIFFISLSIAFGSETTRPAIYAGTFYPKQPSELIQLIEHLVNQARKTDIAIDNKRLKALIMPHAGYIYSGLTASHASLVLCQNNKFLKVIVLGTDHNVGFQNCCISSKKAYQTPLGTILLHKEDIKSLLNTNLFNYNPYADAKEHSIEVILPFLQYLIGDFSLVPIIMGSGNTGQFAQAINSILDSNTLIIASSDLSHYLPYKNAAEQDKETINNILKLNFNYFIKSKNIACGSIPIITLIKLAKQYNWQPALLHYSNSGDTAGSKEKVVGYACIAFYENREGSQMNKQSNENFTQKQGEQLVKLARLTLSEHFNKNYHKDLLKYLEQFKNDEDFEKKAGTFVTLTKNGNLRGCIGNLIADDTIIKGVQRNALSAAFSDTRFAPLQEKELNNIHIEVSVLTEPKPLEYTDSRDLISKLRPNIDGVIIQKGFYKATFLPQVWEQLPDPENFLSHLCLKAGMSPSAWQNDKLMVFVYQVQYFEE